MPAGHDTSHHRIKYRAPPELFDRSQVWPGRPVAALPPEGQIMFWLTGRWRRGRYPNEDRFGVRFTYDITNKPSGQRMTRAVLFVGALAGCTASSATRTPPARPADNADAAAAGQDSGLAPSTDGPPQASASPKPSRAERARAASAWRTAYDWNGDGVHLTPHRSLSLMPTELFSWLRSRVASTEGLQHARFARQRIAQAFANELSNPD